MPATAEGGLLLTGCRENVNMRSPTACKHACVSESVVAVGSFCQHFPDVLSGVATFSAKQPNRDSDDIQPGS